MNDSISVIRANLPAPVHQAPFTSIPSSSESQASASEGDISQKPDEPTIDELVEEFRMYGKLAAEDKVRRCVPLARAKRQESPRFDDFCERVGLRAKSSTVRKYVKFGRHADWLLTITEYLPSEWTTIFAVTVIGRVGALRLIEVGALHPEVTGAELAMAAALLRAAPEGASVPFDTSQSHVLKVSVSGRSERECLSIYQAIKKTVEPFSLSVTGLPKHLSDLLIRETEAA